MKKFAALLLVLACIVGCTGCFCSHQWVEADCLNPKTCPLCGKTEGKAPGHRWQEATCLAPQICQICGQTQGETVDHGWVDASCVAPRGCRWCHVTEGDILDHTWEKATTEAPKTCSGCGLTDGDRIITDERFTTAANRVLFGTWEMETVMDGEAMHLEEFMEQVQVVMTLTFGEDGTLEKEYRVKDPEALLTELIGITEERLYVRFEEKNIDREDADEQFLDTYDMTISEYAADFWADADLNGMLAVYNVRGVYYASGEELNRANSWEEEFVSSTFALDGDRLTVTDSEGNTQELTRIEK